MGKDELEQAGVVQLGAGGPGAEEPAGAREERVAQDGGDGDVQGGAVGQVRGLGEAGGERRAGEDGGDGAGEVLVFGVAVGAAGVGEDLVAGEGEEDLLDAGGGGGGAGRGGLADEGGFAEGAEGAGAALLDGVVGGFGEVVECGAKDEPERLEADPDVHCGLRFFGEEDVAADEGGDADEG